MKKIIIILFVLLNIVSLAIADEDYMGIFNGKAEVKKMWTKFPCSARYGPSKDKSWYRKYNKNIEVTVLKHKGKWLHNGWYAIGYRGFDYYQINGWLPEDALTDVEPDLSIKIGMTREEVLERWQKPKKINRSVGRWGVHEQWIYGDVYLYFENGVLTSWQEW